MLKRIYRKLKMNFSPWRRGLKVGVGILELKLNLGEREINLKANKLLK